VGERCLEVAEKASASSTSGTSRARDRASGSIPP